MKLDLVVLISESCSVMPYFLEAKDGDVKLESTRVASPHSDANCASNSHPYPCKLASVSILGGGIASRLGAHPITTKHRVDRRVASWVFDLGFLRGVGVGIGGVG